MTTGERIRLRRKELGMTADTLAEKIGVSRSTMFRYENGYIEKMPMNNLVPIARVLNTTVGYLMGWDEEKEVPISRLEDGLEKEAMDCFESLPEDLRRAWLEGDWDVFAGQFFREFRRDKHVCEPFVIPQHWKRYFALDYGLDMFAGLWAAFDEEGRCYVYREAHSPEMKISDAAAKIRSHDSDEITAYFAPPDLWGRSADTGKSQAERYAEEGVFLSKVNANRIAGWLEVKEWLAGDRPRLQIFSNCENLIRCLPLLQHDPHRPEDCANYPHEITHAPDALRYLLSGRPNAVGEKNKQTEILPFALQTQEQEKGGIITW